MMLGAGLCCPDSKRGKRREAMLEAAHALFVEKGYDATTLGDIVARSGGSLATLYDLFENKPGLLRALVSDRCVHIGGALDCALATNRPHREMLRTIAEEMLDRLLDPAYVGLFQVVAAQCAAHPDLGRQLYEAGPAVHKAKGADYLGQLAAAGTLAVENPDAASRMFFQMVCGDIHSQLVFGLPVELSKKDRARHLDFVIQAFLKIFEPDHSSRS